MHQHALVPSVFASLGFLSPANRGALFTALLLCFVFLGYACVPPTRRV